MENEKNIGESFDLPNDILDYTDKVATGQEFGKTPSTANYKNLGEYWDDGSDEEKALKTELWDQHRIAPEPEKLLQYKQASEIYSKAIGDVEEDHYTVEQAVDAAIAADVALELSTIIGSEVRSSILFSSLDDSERDSVERGLYDGDSSAINRMKETQLGYNEEEKTKQGEEVMQCVELRKALFERIKEQHSSGYDSLAEEVPFVENGGE